MNATVQPVESLGKKCILTVARLLKSYNWVSRELCEKSNPFSSFPSQVVEELISAVIKLTPRGKLQHKELCPLLKSGRIRNFELRDLLIDTGEFICILGSLGNYAKKLIKVVFCRVHCIKSNRAKLLRSEAVEQLLCLSSNLEHLYLDIPVDIEILKYNTNLKWLELSFFPRRGELNSLFAETKTSHLLPPCNLQHVAIFEGSQYVIPVEMLALLLQQAPRLMHLENNIAEALEYLHGKELDSGTINHQYSLCRIVLGSSFLEPDRLPASYKSVKIAAMTCPNISEIDLIVNSHNAILAVCEMKILHAVIIQWADVIPSGDFQVAFLPLLQVTGHQLTSLGIIFFSNVDFGLIISLCPHLVTLKVIFEMETQKYSWPENTLCELKTLHLECMNSTGPSEGVLILLISKCPDINSLFLVHVPHFTDNVLYRIATKTSLTKLQDATIVDCHLSLDGLKLFLKLCPLLATLRFRSLNFVLEEATTVIQCTNSKVKITYL